MESFRLRLIGKLFKRYEKGYGWDYLLSPRIRSNVDKDMQNGRHCKVIAIRDDEYKVREGLTYLLLTIGLGHVIA